MAPCAALVSSGSAITRQAGNTRQAAQPRRSVLVQASSGGGGEELGKQFEAFKRQMNAQVDRNVTTAPPRFNKQQQRGGWNDNSTADQVRRQEAKVLDFWTSERGMQLAAGGTMVLVLLLLLSAGGPPADARCTLPWC